MISRPRTIQPSAFLDEKLWDAGQSTGLPLFQGFAGIWCAADREGRFEWKPRELKLVVLPYWAGDFEHVLSALAEYGFVLPYEVDGRRYGLVPNFKKHQHINAKEQVSKLPAVPRGTRQQARDVHASTSREPRDSDALFLDLFQDQVSDLDPGSSPSSASSQDLTGSARVDGDSEPDDSEPPQKTPFKSDEEREVFEYWASKLWSLVHGKRMPRATPSRLSRIRARLRESYTIHDLKRVVDAVSESKWHLGENPNNRAYIEPETIFQNTETVDGWLTKRAGKAPGLIAHEKNASEADRNLLEAIKRGEYDERSKALARAGRIGLGNLEQWKEWRRKQVAKQMEASNVR